MGNLAMKNGEDAYEVIKTMIPWTEKMYDMSPEEITTYKQACAAEYDNDKEKTSSRSSLDVIYIEYKYYQLRRDAAWVEDQMRGIGDRDIVLREILLQRSRASNDSPFDLETIEYFLNNTKQPSGELLINGKWLFKLYSHHQSMVDNKPKLLDETIPYLVGIDPASGGGGDNFAIVIVNPYTLEIAAEFKNKYIGQTPAANLLVTLVKQYIPKSILCIERNSMGIYLIQKLIDETEIKDNLYWNKKANELKDMVSETEGDKLLESMSKLYKEYGTYTSPPVRKRMFEILFNHVGECRETFVTEFMVEDLCNLVKNETTGKIAARKRQHDDNVLAYLHAMYIYYTGDNLRRFGINKDAHPVLSKTEDVESPFDEPEVINYYKAENVTFEDIAMAAQIQAEIRSVEMQKKLSFVSDPYITVKRDNYDDEFDDEDIDLSYFDRLNSH